MHHYPWIQNTPRNTSPRPRSRSKISKHCRFTSSTQSIPKKLKGNDNSTSFEPALYPLVIQIDKQNQPPSSIYIHTEPSTTSTHSNPSSNHSQVLNPYPIINPQECRFQRRAEEALTTEFQSLNTNTEKCDWKIENTTATSAYFRQRIQFQFSESQAHLQANQNRNDSGSGSCSNTECPTPSSIPAPTHLWPSRQTTEVWNLQLLSSLQQSKLTHSTNQSTINNTNNDSLPRDHDWKSGWTSSSSSRNPCDVNGNYKENAYKNYVTATNGNGQKAQGPSADRTKENQNPLSVGSAQLLQAYRHLVQTFVQHFSVEDLDPSISQSMILGLDQNQTQMWNFKGGQGAKFVNDNPDNDMSRSIPAAYRHQHEPSTLSTLPLSKKNLANSNAAATQDFSGSSSPTAREKKSIAGKKLTVNFDEKPIDYNGNEQETDSGGIKSPSKIPKRQKPAVAGTVNIDRINVKKWRRQTQIQTEVSVPVETKVEKIKKEDPPIPVSFKPKIRTRQSIVQTQPSVTSYNSNNGYANQNVSQKTPTVVPKTPTRVEDLPRPPTRNSYNNTNLTLIAGNNGLRGKASQVHMPPDYFPGPHPYIHKPWRQGMKLKSTVRRKRMRQKSALRLNVNNNAKSNGNNNNNNNKNNNANINYNANNNNSNNNNFNNNSNSANNNNNNINQNQNQPVAFAPFHQCQYPFGVPGTPIDPNSNSQNQVFFFPLPQGQGQGQGQYPTQALIQGQIPNQALIQGQIPNQALIQGQIPNQGQVQGQIQNQALIQGQFPNQVLIQGQIPNQDQVLGQIQNQVQLLQGQIQNQFQAQAQTEIQNQGQGQGQGRIPTALTGNSALPPQEQQQQNIYGCNVFALPSQTPAVFANADYLASLGIAQQIESLLNPVTFHNGGNINMNGNGGSNPVTATATAAQLPAQMPMPITMPMQMQVPMTMPMQMPIPMQMPMSMVQVPCRGRLPAALSLPCGAGCCCGEGLPLPMHLSGAIPAFMMPIPQGMRLSYLEPPGGGNSDDADAGAKEKDGENPENEEAEGQVICCIPCPKKCTCKRKREPLIIPASKPCCPCISSCDCECKCCPCPCPCPCPCDSDCNSRNNCCCSYGCC